VDEVRTAKEALAEQLIATARNEAAEIRAAAAAAAEALTARGRVDAEELLARARNDALERLNTAQSEAEQVLTEASHQADAIVAASRENNRRLSRRTAQLREAVVEFEAHIANLAQVAGDRTGLIEDMIEQHLEREHSPERRDMTASTSGAPARAPRKRGRAKKGPKSTPSDPIDTVVAIDIADQDYAAEEFVYDGAERQAAPTPQGEQGGGTVEAAADATEEASDEVATDTIYQRRGGGIKRRVAAMHVVENDEAS
jgi:hypothetical protein